MYLIYKEIVLANLIDQTLIFNLLLTVNVLFLNNIFI